MSQSRRAKRSGASSALLLALAAFATSEAADEMPRIVAIGDVHGAYAPFVDVLRAASVIGEDLGWAGGNARLVVLGDVLDRGTESRRALELIMALSQQAPRSGGSVELVLGNHEVMNLVGDLRYVTAAELAAYAADELPADREAAWQRFRTVVNDAPDARERFTARYPLGFFGHRAAFAPSGVLGSWLLERPVLVTIDGTAFVHGGLPGAIAGKPASEINAEALGALHDYLDAVTELEAAGVVHREDGIGERAAAAERYVSASAADSEARRAAARVAAFVRSPLLGGDAVFWYRGTAACSAAIEQTRLEAVLDSLGAKRVVIGHTPTRDRVVTRLNGRVVRADTGMLPSYGGAPAAVVIHGDEVRALYSGSTAEVAAEPQRRAVGIAVQGLADDDIEKLLIEGRVLRRTPRGNGTELWELESGGTRVAAVFRFGPRRGFAALPDVAAYRLDRLLELDIVPVTVRRENDGRVGSLTLDAATLSTEAQRAADPAAEPTCPLRDQWRAMLVFDALAHNDGRSAAEVRYRRSDWSLVLTNNENLFGTAADVPAYLRRENLEVSAYLAERLRTLDEPSLAQSFGDVLDAPRRAALLPAPRPVARSLERIAVDVVHTGQRLDAVQPARHVRPLVGVVARHLQHRDRSEARDVGDRRPVEGEPLTLAELAVHELQDVIAARIDLFVRQLDRVGTADLRALHPRSLVHFVRRLRHPLRDFRLALGVGRQPLTLGIVLARQIHEARVRVGDRESAVLQGGHLAERIQREIRLALVLAAVHVELDELVGLAQQREQQAHLVAVDRSFGRVDADHGSVVQVQRPAVHVANVQRPDGVLRVAQHTGRREDVAGPRNPRAATGARFDQPVRRKVVVGCKDGVARDPEELR